MKIILNIVTNCPSMADAREYFDMAIKLQNIEIRFDALWAWNLEPQQQGKQENPLQLFRRGVT